MFPGKLQHSNSNHALRLIVLMVWDCEQIRFYASSKAVTTAFVDASRSNTVDLSRPKASRGFFCNNTRMWMSLRPNANQKVYPESAHSYSIRDSQALSGMHLLEAVCGAS